MVINWEIIVTIIGDYYSNYYSEIIKKTDIKKR